MHSSSFFILLFLIFLLLPIMEINAHSLFNSAESTIGNYRVQVATLPEIPAPNEPMQILFRVTDRDLNEVDRFTMGIRIFYNDLQIDAIPPKMFDDGHMEIEYILENSGIHIFRVDLYDVAKDGGVLSYTFNIGTQNPFGYAFIISITVGAIGLAGILVYIYVPKMLRKRSKP